MARTKSTDAGISQRTTVYAERQMLKHAGPVIVLDRFGMLRPMPKNKGTTIKFRRPNVFAAATVPLVEGVTPTTTQFSYTDVEATLKQYGQVVEITDVIADTHEDPVLNDAAQQSGENIGRTTEALTFGIVKAGTNVYRANGSARTDINTPVTLNKLRAVIKFLKAQKAMRITRILDGSINYATHPIEAGYIAVCHTDLEPDLRDLPGFKSTADYGSRKPIHETEFGSVEALRFLCSPDLGPWEDGGAAKAGSGVTMVSTGGTSADIYPILIFGKDAYGRVPLRGQGAISPSIIPPGIKDKSDPLGQIGYVGWIMWYVCKILNDNWIARLEVAVTDID